MNQLKKLVLAAVAALLSMSGYAVDLGAIELGRVYNVPSFAEVTATFTAPSTGTLLQDGVADLKIQGMDGEFIDWGNYGQVYAYEVEEGVTYTLYSSFVMNGGNVVWTMQGDADLTVTDIDPKPGSVLSTTTNYIGDVFVKFSEQAYAESAKLITGSASADATITQQGSLTLIVNVKDALDLLFANGDLNPAGGDNVKLVISGVKNSAGTAYDGTGVIEIPFVSAPKALVMIASNCKEYQQLKSYYPPGDPEGILEFTFDGNVGRGASFIISAGDPASEAAYYYEVVPAVTDGAKITVDLTGKLRVLTAYVDATNYVGGKLSGVTDTNGNPAEGGGPGNVGSYSYTLVYDYIEPVVISSEFTPASGASLKGVDKIEIWFNNADKIRFDGVKFSTPETTVVVPNADLSIERDGNDVVIVVGVPAEIAGKTDITVTLDNLVSLDGYDHSAELTARYDTFVATLVSPILAGRAYESTGDDDFVFVFNQTFGYMRYDFYSGDEWLYGTQINPQENGTYTSYNGNYTLYSNVDNYMVVRCYNEESEYWSGAKEEAKAEFHFIGLTSPFSFSDVKFVSIDPEPNTVITPTDNFAFTVVFDGLVRIGDESCINLGMGMSMPFEKVEPVDPEELTGLANTWKLYPSQSAFSGTGIDISIYAYDENGKLVEGNMGGGEYDFLQFSWSILSADNYKALTVTPADGSTLEEIRSFEISYPAQPVGINYGFTGDMPQITDELGNVLYTFTANDIEVVAPLDDEMTVVNMYVNPAITSEGVYALCIPADFFIIGSQFETYYNEAYNGTYIIDSNDGIKSLFVDKADTYTVYDLNGRKVMDTDNASDLGTLNRGIYIINGKKTIIR